ncbi:hypothetical protein HFP15_07590 [Amycolatopsis sp. K13G38]|uniref:Uncharacterized protein n=1 Tax=Amycolatopsis acididurans TaxID=2724524 RepID=A0ABX1IZ08_9PSEU|nr:hypothetical protein [Amycolatopsis acididurans]NKQ52742.1 hypothetical protein [Amycolatopsis acididurans]
MARWSAPRIHSRAAGAPLPGLIGVLELEQADRALAELGEDSDRMADALVAMDSHPGNQLLAGATLTGVTLRRWSEASAAMSVLWQQFSMHRALVDQARQVRERKSRPGPAELAELTELLTGPVVELNAEQVPIERRGLTGPAVVVERVTLSELVGTMKTAYAKVTEVLAAAEKAWDRTIERLEPLDADLRAARALAESLGVDEPALARFATELAELRAGALSDPLGSEPDPAPVRASLAKTRAGLDDLAAARDSFAERKEGIEASVAETADIDARASAVFATVREKIANPGLPVVEEQAAVLRNRVAQLPALWRAQDWKALSANLESLERDAGRALAEARTRLELGTGLLDRRLELRGRLEAYRAKARQLGYVEDLDLGTLHQRAHDLLYTSPCDLRAATVAVNRYQQALADRRGEQP